MKILAPIDGSDCSYRALDFATEFVDRYEGTLHVVHITSSEGPTAEKILSRARELLEENGVSDNPEIITDLQHRSPRYGTRKGKQILELVEERGYDHVVMGHHGSGAVDRLILGSVADTVIDASDVPTTVVP